MAHVVTAFLRHRGQMLLVRRSDEVGTHRGQWAGVSGFVESGSGGTTHAGDGDHSPTILTDARRELAEEVGVLDATLVRAGEPVEVDDDEGRFTVHPFLFDYPGDDRPGLTLNGELVEAAWVQPPAILDRDTVPKLWAAYEAVAPTVEDVRGDQTHGSAYVSLRALEVLRDRAATAAVADRESAVAGSDGWESVAEVARELRDARPSMTALATRVNRVMSRADRSPAAVRDRAEVAVADAVDADAGAAANAAALLDDRGIDRVLTLSRSGTVRDALLSARPSVLVAESRTAREGVGVAESLADEGLEVTLAPDAAAGFAFADQADVDAPDALLVGADTVFPDGGVANKVGTRALALSAAREAVPGYVVAARDKIAPETDRSADADDGADANGGSEGGAPDGFGTGAGSGVEFTQEFEDEDALYDGAGGLSVWNPVFDRTPADAVSGVVTEDGVLDADDVASVAADYAGLAAWDDR
jgi:translation initiation factor 2B subunit (eIF-2B alpha/beta/delta family)/8-oxo-dGTP pyrophosphatase MutT (NUDIX family)